MTKRREITPAALMGVQVYEMGEGLQSMRKGGGRLDGEIEGWMDGWK